MPILGIDEVGRGPLAGPLIVGAVILPDTRESWQAELKDSKKLSPKKRTELSQLILATSATGLGWVSALELDQIGISAALRLATRRAVESIRSLHTPFSQIIIDGTINFLSNTSLADYTSTLIKADAKIPAVSAASIIAKVARDQYMISLADKYPEYSFNRHVGYGTAAHIKAIYQYGLTPEHRRSFEPCKTLSGFTTSPHNPRKATKKNTTDLGQQAESAVSSYLSAQNHTIIARNYKTFFYEIDIISVKDDHIYFTEVKYRHNNTYGSGLDAVTKDKLERMQFAANSYLKYHASKFGHLNPLLAAAAVSGPNYHIDDWLVIN